MADKSYLFIFEDTGEPPYITIADSFKKALINISYYFSGKDDVFEKSLEGFSYDEYDYMIQLFNTFFTEVKIKCVYDVLKRMYPKGG